ncbi:hypothetical protein FOA52_014222 [Chlamydomonas sp. UWO 241]|nr:hypothetical protein FOA52_014222 [Chlamydomonas sp. UWO 241]
MHGAQLARRGATLFASLSLGGGGEAQQQQQGRSAPPSESPLQPSQLLHDGRYRVDDLYGVGEHCEVWTGVEVSSGRRVAIKVNRDGGFVAHALAAREGELALGAQPGRPRLPASVVDLDAAAAAAAEAAATAAAAAAALKPAARAGKPEAVAAAAAAAAAAAIAAKPAKRLGKRAAAAAAAEADAAAAAVARDPPVVRCLAAFDVYSASGGAHSCLVMEQLGDSVSAVQREYIGGLGVGLPLPVVRQLTRRLVSSLDYLHRSRGIVHRDVSPDNVLLVAPFQTELQMDGWEAAKLQVANFFRGLVRLEPLAPQLPPPPPGCVSERNLHRAHVKLADFGRARPLGEADVPHPGEGMISTYAPGGRPPEDVLGLPTTPAYDVWQLGLLVWWLSTGLPLFAPEPRTLSSIGDGQDGQDRQGGDARGAAARPRDRLYDVNDIHLADMTTVLGHCPRALVEASPVRGLYFRRSGRLRMEADVQLESTTLRDLLTRGCSFGDEEADSLAGFLTPLLQWDPAARPSAQQLLAHPWLAASQPGDGRAGARQEKAGSQGRAGAGAVGAVGAGAGERRVGGGVAAAGGAAGVEQGGGWAPAVVFSDWGSEEEEAGRGS